MKTELERLQKALKYQQRYLSFLNRIGPRVILGVGTPVTLLVLVACHLRMSRGLSLAVWILVGVLGLVMWVSILTGVIWLLRMLTRGLIASYQEAIEKLEREE